MPTADGPLNDICPYATSNNHFHMHQPNSHGKICLNSRKIIVIYLDPKLDIHFYSFSNALFNLGSSATLLRRGMPNGASSGSSSGSSASHRLIQGGPGCSATLGRVKNLEMTEYQKEKLINEANTVKIKVKKCLHSHIVFIFILPRIDFGYEDVFFCV